MTPMSTYGERRTPVRRNLRYLWSQTAEWRICTPASTSHSAGRL